jgi:uncharacterized membrane protein YecN with MAPEG domain
MTIPVTALYGSLNALLNILLAVRVSNARRSEKVSLGTGDSQELLVRVRTHANSAEFVPLAMLMLLIAELSGGSSTWLHAIGGSLFVARIIHIPGMRMKAPNAARVAGNAITWLDIAGTALWVLWMRFVH